MPDEPHFPTLSAIASCCGTRAENVDTDLLQGIRAAMLRYNINTRLRQVHFLAQIGHESNGLVHTEEIWGPTPQQQRYEPPSDLADRLGNTQPGDGHRYKGRGCIMLTGRANYQAYNKAVPVNVVQRPELVAEPEFASDVAGWYWDRAGLSSIADQGIEGEEVDEPTAREITEEINGGYNGWSDRLDRLKGAKAELFARDIERVPAAEVEEIITTDPTDDAHELSGGAA